MSKGLRKLTACNKNNALIIFVNQLRKNPGAGPYANPEYTPGGQSLKFYSSMRVDVRRGDFIVDEEGDEKKKKIGQVVKFRVVKNKTDVPHKEGDFKFLYTGEIDKYDELISLGLLNDKIERKGPYYYFVGKTFQGRGEMEDTFKKQPELFEQARKEVFDG
jgi:recombination protein RecA